MKSNSKDECSKERSAELVEMKHASNYPIKRLCDVDVSLLDCEHRTPKAVREGFPYIAIPNIKEGRLDLSDVRLISKNDFDSWTIKTKPKSGDIIITRRARVGDTAVIPQGLECAIGQNLVIIRSNGSQVDQSYLRWALRGPIYEEQVRKFMNVGAVFDSLNCADIPKFEIPVPSLINQRAIARILGTLDDKIELNRRMNETLEAMARAIFKSWFVDFDPVRAKAEGREPAGTDAETAALFPDSFEETELGMVPRGWRVGSFDETIELIGGGTPRTSVPDYWNGDILWFSVVDSPEKSDAFVIDTQKKITQRGIDESSTKLLPKGTTIITARGTVGKCALVGNPMAMNQSCYGVRAVDQRGDYFIYFALRDLVSELQRSTHGSVFDTITSETFKAVQVVIVPVGLTRTFDEKISEFMGRILSNLLESRALIALLDILLPKLLSGEIRLKKSEIMMEASYGNNLSLSS
jgi:type I restriction enzyme, S subunit